MKKKEPDHSLPSPGQQLLKAREEKDISAEMVAERLRLDVNFIHALEKDDYEKFPAIAYVRGHLRGYANMVGLDPEQLISVFDQKSKTAPSLEPLVSQPKQQAGSGDKHIKVVTWSLVAALALLLGLWWQTQRSTQEEPADQSVSQEEIETEEVSTIEFMEGTTGTLSLEVQDEEPPVQEEPKELAHVFGVQQFSELPEPPEQNYQTELPISTPVQSMSDIGQTPEIVPTLSSTDRLQIANQDIVLQFTADSWIQITDSTGAKQFSRLGKADEVVNVTGVAPFRVVIGRASVVIMSYQGNFIDLDSLAKNEVARFTLDETGAYR